MSLSLQPVDQAQRQLALDPEQSFICEAPAGSGKTELLTQRVLTLLARVDKPESILAITFTRKAAAEMRARIVHALEAGTGEKPSAPHAQTTWALAQAVLQRDAERQWHLLQNPNRLQIRTFDSLCAMLTQALPLHSALGVNISTSDDADALYREAIAQFLETLEQDVPWAESLRFLLLHLDNLFHRVEDLFIKMLRSRDAWLPVVNATLSGDEVRKMLEAHLQHAVDDHVDRLQALLPEHTLKPLLQAADFAAANLARMNFESPLRSLVRIGGDFSWPDSSPSGQTQWRALTHLLLTRDGEWRKRLDKNGGFPPGEDKHEKVAFKQQKDAMQAVLTDLASVPDLLEALRDINHWPSTTYRESQWQVLQALTRVLPVLVAHLQLVFRAKGEVDFLEMSTRARQALGNEGEPTDLALRLDYVIAHILVDEFQDTSFSQVELIQQLTSGWQPGDGRTLFCVGDAMQSIYAFRGANVGLFLHCRANGLGQISLTPIQLTTNFRSQASVVQWLNHTFSRAFPARHDISSGAVGYSTADEFRPSLPGSGVETHVYSADQPELEGRLVVDLIAQSRTQNPNGSIAILVRNRKHVLAIVPALQLAGLRFRAVDLEPLAEQEVVADLVTFTRALLYPTDRIAWLSLLRGPWCGLTLAELEWLTQRLSDRSDVLLFDLIRAALEDLVSEASDVVCRATDDALASPSPCLSISGRERLQRVFNLMVTALTERQRKPLRTWVEGVWLQLGGASCLASGAEASSVERYFSLLESLAEQSDVLSLEQLQRHLSQLYAAPDPLADDSLQIMTIHKSKGLEFDTVILPGLHRQPRADDPALLLWQERLTLQGDEEWMLAPISPVGQEKDPIYKHLEYQKKKREHFEACRLLYVACTRAKQRLYLLAEVTRAEGDDVRFKPPRSSSLLAYIWPSVEISAHCYEQQAMDARPTDPSSSTRLLKRLPSSWRLPALPEGTLLDRFVPPFDFNNQRMATSEWMTIDGSISESPWQRQSRANLLRHVGTLVHHILQTIGEQGLSSWRERNLHECEGAWLSRLVALGLSPDDAKMAMPQVVQCVQRSLANEQFIWLLSGTCQFEFPISSISNTGVKHSVIDVLRFDSEQALVVDYKTSFPAANQDLHQFVQAEISQYRKVMDEYCVRVQQLGYKKVQAALFFPMLGHWQLV